MFGLKPLFNGMQTYPFGYNDKNRREVHSKQLMGKNTEESELKERIQALSSELQLLTEECNDKKFEGTPTSCYFSC